MADVAPHLLAREVRILTTIIAKVAHESLEQQLAACEAGVSAMQYGMLRMLQARPRTISELSRTFVVDPSTLVPVVDALERKGLVRRARDPMDRRRVPLVLTDGARELLGRDLPLERGDRLAHGLSAMGEGRAQQLLLLLRELMCQLPDGESMLREIASRLQSAECPPAPGD